jgi:hypothetical protein
MGGKGGGGAVATNDQMVQMQQQQAAQAAEASRQTQARLQQGVSEITSQFEGHPKGATLLDLSGILHPAPPPPPPPAPPVDPATAAATAPIAGQYALPPGVTRGPDGSLVPPEAPAIGTPFQPYTPPAPAYDPTKGGGLPSGYTWGVLPSTGGAQSWGIFDPSGNLVTDATSLDALSKAQIYVGGDTSQKEGGFGTDFYNNYRNSITGYYLPQEDQQYQDARSTLNYSLARAGQLNSGVAGMDIGKLANQDAIAQANIQSQADQQTGNLRTQIAQNEQDALNQLYSTEDPTVAANTAEHMVANADLTKPILSPLSGLFNNISVGVGNALTGFMNPYAYINTGAQGMGMGTTPGSGQVAGGSTSSGSNVNA